jgi:hypothetical protein
MRRRGRRQRRDMRHRCFFEKLEPRMVLSVSVTTWHNDPARTGENTNEVMLTPSNVGSGTFGKLFSYPVQGQVYAQPLYVSNLAIPGKGTHNVIFVVTENDDVYALDANSNAGASAGVLWHVNLAPPGGSAAASPVSYFGTSSRYGPYHDINPQVGITSTPVIDLSTNTMYLDAFTNDVTGQNSYSHHIHALDITTGADKVTPMLVAASVQGNGNGGNGTTVPWVATQQLQRPALTLLNGVLYVAYSGYADVDPYHGWILGFNPTNLQLVSVLNTTPNLLPGGTENTDGGQAGEGGIWMTGAGLASDGTNMFLMTGNGDFTASLGDYGDSVLKISPDPTSTQANPNITGYGIRVGDYFTPFNQANLASADADLGSGGGIVLPDQPGADSHEYVGSGKSGVIYLINRDAMGGYNASTDTGRVIQEINLGSGNFDTAAYFNGSIYYNGVNDVLKRYSLGLNNGVTMLSAAPAAQSTVSYSGSGQGATPSISANGTANGIVWNIQFSSSHEVLHAYDATTLTELYNTNQNTARDQLGVGVKFITPTIADGEVFVGGSGFVNVYGLLAPPTSPPAAPSNLTAAALSATSVQLQWVNNANNQAGFKIERSNDNGNSYTQIGMAGASALSYVDMTASASTTYLYRIRATNAIGDSAYAGPVSVTTPAVTGAIDVYHFDAGSGTSAIDSVGTNNGTLVGSPLPVWVSGKIGTSALSFSGTGVAMATNQSAVQVANDLSPILGGTASLTAWIKTTQVGKGSALWGDPAITGVEAAGNSNDIRYGYIDTNGHIGVGAGNTGVVSTTAINDGQWHNVAFTRNATTGLCQVYIDGVLQGSVTSDTGNKTSIFRLIGAQSDVASDGVTSQGATYFNGSLDEVRIYNTVLTAADIQGIAIVPSAPTMNAPMLAAGPVVHLSWTTPSSFTQSIEVDRKVGAGGTFSALATLGGGVTSYDDTTVARGTQYFYEVKAIDLAGTSPASNVVNITPPLPVVVAHSVFYNGSMFDGFNGSSNVTDDNAIDTSKQALLPGQTATFQNVTGYSKGMNGVIIDVANFDNLPRFEDFSFQVWDGSNPSGWQTAPIPALINDYPGRGPNGSTQLTIIWDDNVIQNEWLRVDVLADAHTGLPADDISYFGNLVGATGASNTSTQAMVGTADFDAVVADPHGPLNKAPVTSVTDVNHDGLVNANDAIYARNNVGNILPFITAPMGGGAAPGGEGQAVGSISPSPLTENPPLAASGSGPQSAATNSITTNSNTSPPTLLGGLPSAGNLRGAAVPSPVNTPTAWHWQAGRPLGPASAGGAEEASEQLTRPLLQPSAIGAVWNSIDAGHPTSWWSSGQPVDSSSDPAGSSSDGSLEQLLSMLAFDRRHRHD